MQIRFTFDTQFGQFSDALNLPDDHTFTDVELEDMKQARLTSWITAITTPALEEIPGPVVEETLIPDEVI